MKKLFIVANWKSNKTTSEAKEWLQEIINYHLSITNKEVIVCPSFTTLSILRLAIQENNLPIQIGAQDISPFEKGAYTGEVNREQIKELADYVLVGHSERRRHFAEDEEMLTQKVSIAKKSGLKVIFCVQGVETAIPPEVDMVAYEPVFAIGTGNPDTPENANQVALEISKKTSAPILYGGSVSKDNVHSFTMQEHIAGVLVGGASLQAAEFLEIIKNA